MAQADHVEPGPGLRHFRLRAERRRHPDVQVQADRVGEIRSRRAGGYSGSTECHGWLGVRFQSHPRDADSQIIMHVNMLDREKEAQQEALGIVGVNLLYGACFLYHEPELLVESLLDVLRKKPVLVERGSFRPVTHVNVDMMECALEKFGREPDVESKDIVPLMEITMRNLLSTGSRRS